MTKLHFGKPTHKQILVIFWSLVSIMLTSWIIIFTNPYHKSLDNAEPFIGQILFLMNLCFLPVMILVPLIGGGYFKNKELLSK